MFCHVVLKLFWLYIYIIRLEVYILQHTLVVSISIIVPYCNACDCGPKRQTCKRSLREALSFMEAHRRAREELPRPGAQFRYQPRS